MGALRETIKGHQLKRFFRWVIWSITLFFIGRTLLLNWPAVQEITLTSTSLQWLVLAWVISLLAHSWAGWVWHWLFEAWSLPMGGAWAMRVYLFTNVAKYLPGNFWHFYGRVRAVQNRGGRLGQAVASVVAEPLVMAVAAVGLGAIASALSLLSLLGTGTRLLATNRIGSGPLWTLGLFGLWAIALVLLRPKWLNPRLRKMSQLKIPKLRRKAITSQEDLASATPHFSHTDLRALKLQSYPLKPLLGEMGFVLGRSLGFMATVLALTSLNLSEMLFLVSAFSLAWVLGLIVPGAPGGIGVFEASALILLEGQLPAGTVIASVALYRLIGTLAEIFGAALAWLYAALGRGFDY